MLNSQFSLDVKTIGLFKEMKNTPMYSDYIRNITSSPIFGVMLSEHIKNIDFVDDIKKYKDCSPQQLNTAIKTTLTKSAVTIIADTIMLYELAECKIQDVSHGLLEDFNTKYVMGLADKNVYEQAEQCLQDVTNIDTMSVLYIGLVEYKRRNKLIKTSLKLPKINNTQTPPSIPSNTQSLDLDSDDINL